MQRSPRKRPSSNPPGRPKNDDSADTFDRILSSALRLFSKRGYRGTQNREVAAEAGVTSSTLYYYFGNKAEMYVAVFKATEGRLSRRLREAAETGETTRERLAALVAESRAFHASDPHGLTFLAQAAIEARYNREVAARLAGVSMEIEKLVRAILQRGRDAGELSDDVDTQAAADMIAAVTVGIAIYAPPGVAPDYAPVSLALEALVRGKLLPPEGPDASD